MKQHHRRQRRRALGRISEHRIHLDAVTGPDTFAPNGKLIFLILKRSKISQGNNDLFVILNKLSKMAVSDCWGYICPVMNVSGNQPIKKNSSSVFDK